MGVVRKFFVEFVDRNADLVEISVVAELDAARHHVDVEALHVRIADICPGIDDDGEAIVTFVRRMLLPVHVVGLLGAELAETTRRVEHEFGLVNVNVDLRFALAAGKHQRIAEFRKCFTQLAAVNVRPCHHALGAVAKT